MEHIQRRLLSSLRLPKWIDPQPNDRFTKVSTCVHLRQSSYALAVCEKNNQKAFGSPCKSSLHPLYWKCPVATPRQRISESPHTSDNVNRPDSRKHIFWTNLFRISKPAESGSKQPKPGTPCKSRIPGLFACLLSTIWVHFCYHHSTGTMNFVYDTAYWQCCWWRGDPADFLLISDIFVNFFHLQ